MMKAFVGCKIVWAEPCTLYAFVLRFPARKASLMDHDEVPDQDGYHVKYPDGYESWSPAAQFETAYREITIEEKAMVR